MRVYPTLWRVTDNNEFLEDLTPHVRRGRVSFDPDRTIKWAFEAEIDARANIKPFKDCIAPFLTVVQDNGSTATSQFGVYLTVPPRQTIAETHSTITIDSRDLSWLLTQHVYANQHSLAAGVNIIDAVKALITGVGITRVLIPSHAAVLPYDTTWNAGTNRLTIINDLLRMVGYYSLFMDKQGYLVSRPYVADKNKAPSVTYETNDIIRVAQRDTTPERIANRVVVIGSTGDSIPIVAVRQNTSPLSPISIPSLGRTITKTVKDVQVVDQAAAEILAQQHLDRASQEYHRLTLHTLPDLTIEPHNVYRLNITDANGNVIDGVWNQRGWSLGFTPEDAAMTHEMSNIDTPPDDIGG